MDGWSEHANPIWDSRNLPKGKFMNSHSGCKDHEGTLYPK